MKKFYFVFVGFGGGSRWRIFGKVMAASEINADGEQTQLRKNVLMIAVDDLKPLLGCYGDSLAKTPNIDRLAERGVVFTSAYCQQAVSAATRASLLQVGAPTVRVGFENIDSFTESGCCHIAALSRKADIQWPVLGEDI